MRRRMVLNVAVLACALGAFGCEATMSSFTPGMQENAHPLAYQAASFSYGFMNSGTMLWASTLDGLERDALPFFEKAANKGYTVRVGVKAQQAGGTEYYDVQLFMKPPSGDALAEAAAQAEGGELSAMDPRVAQALGSTPVDAQKALFAVAKFVNNLTTLNVANDTLQRHAFALLVLREKAGRGERADWFGKRPPAETSADVDLALRVIADDHADAAVRRAEILGTVALLGAYAEADARAALKDQLADSKKHAAEWQQQHHQPTSDEYGVKMKELKLPTPDALLETLDKHGYIRAAIEVARGIATGDPRLTLEGLQKLAPEDSTIHVALGGLNAALSGDVMGTVDAVAKLTGHEADMSALKSRLNVIKGGVAVAREGLSGTQKTLSDAEKAVKDPKGAVEDSAKKAAPH